MTNTRNLEENEFDKLLGLAHEDLLQPDQLKRLEELLLGDPDVCTRYIEMIALQVDLERGEHIGFTIPSSQAHIPNALDPIEVKGDSTSALTLASSFKHKISDFISKPIPLSLSSAFIFVICLVGTLALISIQRKENSVVQNVDSQIEFTSKKVVATVTDYKGCRWPSGVQPRVVDDVFQEGELIELERGTLQIKFNSSAVALLQGPIQVRFDTNNSMSIIRGKSTFVVPHRAKGFAVDTTNSRIVDLGTEFGVAVNDNDSTLVSVFKGLVEAEIKDAKGVGTGQKYPIKAGESMRFDESKQASAVVPQNTVKDFFIRNVNSYSLDYSRMILKDKPVLYWNFNEKTGPAKELVTRSSSRRLQPSGGAKRVSHLRLDSKLNLGLAADLTGDTDLFIGSFEHQKLPGAWALEMWIQFTKTGPGFTSQYIFHTNPKSPESNNPALIFDFSDGVGGNLDNELELFSKFQGTKGQKPRTDGGPLINDDRWHHLILVYYGNGEGHGITDGVDIYLDGKQLKNVNRNGFHANFSFNKLLVGSSRESGGNGLIGRIDELAVYSLHAMTKTAIQEKIIGMMNRHIKEAKKVTKE